MTVAGQSCIVVVAGYTARHNFPEARPVFWVFRLKDGYLHYCLIPCVNLGPRVFRRKNANAHCLCSRGVVLAVVRSLTLATNPCSVLIEDAKPAGMKNEQQKSSE